MTDIVDPATRSRMMAGIRGKNTRPEMQLRRALHAAGFRYRLHDRQLPGSPDVVLPRYRAVILVHGCYWHHHLGCRYATLPSTRGEFWKTKLLGNVERDNRNRGALVDEGWRVAVVWECALKSRDIASVVGEVAEWLRGERVLVEISGSTGA